MKLHLNNYIYNNNISAAVGLSSYHFISWNAVEAVITALEDLNNKLQSRLIVPRKPLQLYIYFQEGKGEDTWLTGSVKTL